MHELVGKVRESPGMKSVEITCSQGEEKYFKFLSHSIESVSLKSDSPFSPSCCWSLPVVKEKKLLLLLPNLTWNVVVEAVSLFTLDSDSWEKRWDWLSMPFILTRKLRKKDLQIFCRKTGRKVDRSSLSLLMGFLVWKHFQEIICFLPREGFFRKQRSLWRRLLCPQVLWISAKNWRSEGVDCPFRVAVKAFGVFSFWLL